MRYIDGVGHHAEKAPEKEEAPPPVTTAAAHRTSAAEPQRSAPARSAHDAVDLSPPAPFRTNVDRFGQARLAQRMGGSAHEKLENGTEIEVEDGVMVTRRPDGSVREEFQDGLDEVSQETSREGDAQVLETTRTTPDGDSVTKRVVERAGQTETTISRSSTVDADLEEVVPAMRDSHAWDGVPEGGRGPVHVTEVERVVTDTSKHPPVSRVLSKSTAYSQHVDLPEDQARDPELLVDSDRSGYHVAYTTTSALDAHGKHHTVEEEGRSLDLRGQPHFQPAGDEADEARVLDTWALQREDGHKVQEVHAVERRGLGPDLADGPIRKKDEYMDRLEGRLQDSRRTEVTSFGKEGKKSKETTWEYGDIHLGPQEEGRTVTISQADEGARIWTYRQAERSTRTDPFSGEDRPGLHIRSQSNVEGTYNRATHDEFHFDDGTFEIRSDVYAEGGSDPTYSFDQFRRRVPTHGVDHGYTGDPAFMDQFAEGKGSEIFEDSVRVVNTREPNRNYEVRTYTDDKPGSDDRLIVVRGDADCRPGDVTTILEQPDGPIPVRAHLADESGATEFQLDRQNQLEMQTGGRSYDLGGGNPLAKADGPVSGTRMLQSALNKADSERFPDLAPRGQAGVGVVGLVAGSLQLADAFSADNSQDAAGGVLSGGSAVAGGGSEILEAGSAVAARAGRTLMSEALGAGGKMLGRLSLWAGAGVSIYQFSEGQDVQGTLTAVSTAGAAVATGYSALAAAGAIAGGSAWVPVAGWAVAGTALLGGLAYDLYQGDQARKEREKTAELEGF